MKAYKVSVIVCIYKVEKYIKQCLDSIVNQTYSNLEIILIDDGSPDKCPHICDQYAKEDSRIKVVHQKNGGLSDAKNTGLAVASGDLIIFVDGDDFVSLDMFRLMVEKLEESQSDMVICDHYKVFPDYKISIRHKFNEGVLSRHEAISLVLADEIPSHSWNKLCKAELYKNVRFPVGQTYEDIHESYKLFVSSEKIYYLNECLYFYRMNERGISLSGNSRNMYFIYLGFKNRLEFAKSEHPESVRISAKLAIETGMNVYNHALIKEGSWINQFELDELFVYIKNNQRIALNSSATTLNKKIAIRFLCLNRKIYDIAYPIYRKWKVLLSGEL